NTAGSLARPCRAITWWWAIWTDTCIGCKPVTVRSRPPSGFPRRPSAPSRWWWVTSFMWKTWRAVSAPTVCPPTDCGNPLPIMLPVVALVGRPNVGKSTLFNVLTRSRDALVADMPGVTRDRHYGICRSGARPFVVVDTGGLSGVDEAMDVLTAKQVRLAIEEANVLVFVVDAREGLLPQDYIILNELRRSGKPIIAAVNKTDGLDDEAVLAEFSAFGLGSILPLSAAHSRGTGELINTLLPLLPADSESAAEDNGEDGSIRVAIVGRPNAGKSTLINRLLGEDRLIVSDVA